MFQVPHIQDIDVQGKTVLLRAMLNVPMVEGVIDDDFRLTRSIETLFWLKNHGARVIMIGHIEDDNEVTSLEVVHDWYTRHLDLTFITEIFSSYTSRHISRMKDGDVVMLENLRFHEGEKSNNKMFAEMLASYADLYVNDAFPVCHREHASIVGIPALLPAYAGFELTQEISFLSQVFDPPHPFVLVLGGMKFETKLPLVQRFLNRADTIFVGGALAHPIMEQQGLNIGDSVTTKDVYGLAKIAKHPNVFVSRDVVCQVEGVRKTRSITEIKKGDVICDIGPKTLEELESRVRGAALVLWNGPFGNYEQGFDDGTKRFAFFLSEQKDTTTIVGGGDTLAVIHDEDLEHALSFVSTGGGAMIEFLARERLPGIDALKR